MANRRKEIPSFVSIEVGVARSIAEAMTDDEWGKWSKKALDDLSIGCTRNDTDVRVRNLYEKSKENMDKEYLRKKEWYEKRKEGAANGNNADESTTAFESLGSAMPSTDGGTRKDPLNMATVRKNGTLESGTSVEKFSSSQSDQRRAGGISPLSSPSRPSARSGAVDVLNLAYAGEFGNVTLTQEQYAQLGIKFGNQQKLNRAIDSLSCQIENGEKNPQNHYAELVKWASYREDMEEQKIQQSEAPKMTEMEKSWIREAEKIARYEKELAANERR